MYICPNLTLVAAVRHKPPFHLLLRHLHFPTSQSCFPVPFFAPIVPVPASGASAPLSYSARGEPESQTSMPATQHPDPQLPGEKLMRNFRSLTAQLLSDTHQALAGMLHLLHTLHLDVNTELGQAALPPEGMTSKRRQRRAGSLNPATGDSRGLLNLEFNFCLTFIHF